MKISVEVEEEDKEYLQGVIEQVVKSYYNSHGGTYISFDNVVSMDEILQAMGCE